MSADIVGLLLAAGSSRRFGGNKLTQALPDGRWVAEASAHHLATATPRTLALLRHGQTALRTRLEALGLEVNEVSDADAGMGHTLAAGVRATATAGGWIVALADMPCIAPTTIAQLVSALRQGASIAAPRFQGQRGHPVAFSARWYTSLSQLQGDTGARAILQAHAEALTLIDVDDAGCVLDIDTPADLAAAFPGSDPSHNPH